MGLKERIEALEAPKVKFETVEEEKAYLAGFNVACLRARDIAEQQEQETQMVPMAICMRSTLDAERCAGFREENKWLHRILRAIIDSCTDFTDYGTRFDDDKIASILNVYDPLLMYERQQFLEKEKEKENEE